MNKQHTVRSPRLNGLIHRRFLRRLSATALLLGLLPAALQAQLEFFPIGTNVAGMGLAGDGGNYLVGLENHQTTPTSIGAQMVAGSGGKLGGFIPTGRTGTATAIAFDGVNYLLAWEDDGLGTLNGDTGWQMYGQFISKAGQPVGTPFALSTPGIWFDGIKTVAFDGSNYLVIWNDEVDGRGTGTWDVFGQRISPAGALVGDVVPITTEPGPQMATSVAFDGVNYFVAWMDMRIETDWNVYGQFVGRNGALVGSKVTLSADPGNQIAMVSFANGKYLVGVAHGIVMGEGGIEAVDFTVGALMAPLPLPEIMVDGGSPGVWTNRFGFNVSGNSGQTVVIEACIDLAAPAWQPVQTNTFTGGSLYFSDPGWTSYPGRFYRLRLP